MMNTKGTVEHNGRVYIFEGLDGSGKGKGVDALGALARCSRLPNGSLVKVFDLRAYENSFSKEERVVDRKPNPEDLAAYDVLLVAEPTYSGVGFHIRDEVITTDEKRKRVEPYTATETAEWFGKDRHFLYEEVLIPWMQSGGKKIVFQERSFMTSMVYQPLTAMMKGEDFALEDMKKVAGNAYTMRECPPDVAVLACCPAEAALGRLGVRVDKEDDCRFECLPFQQRAERIYEGTEFADALEEELGIRLHRIDTGIRSSLIYTVLQTLAVVQHDLGVRGLMYPLSMKRELEFLRVDLGSFNTFPVISNVDTDFFKSDYGQVKKWIQESRLDPLRCSSRPETATGMHIDGTVERIVDVQKDSEIENGIERYFRDN